MRGAVRVDSRADEDSDRSDADDSEREMDEESVMDCCSSFVKRDPTCSLVTVS